MSVCSPLFPVVNSVVLGVPRSKAVSGIDVDFVDVMVFSKPSFAVTVRLKMSSVEPVTQTYSNVRTAPEPATGVIAAEAMSPAMVEIPSIAKLALVTSS